MERSENDLDNYLRQHGELLKQIGAESARHSQQAAVLAINFRIDTLAAHATHYALATRKTGGAEQDPQTANARDALIERERAYAQIVTQDLASDVRDYRSSRPTTMSDELYEPAYATYYRSYARPTDPETDVSTTLTIITDITGQVVAQRQATFRSESEMLTSFVVTVIDGELTSISAYVSGRRSPDDPDFPTIIDHNTAGLQLLARIEVGAPQSEAELESMIDELIGYATIRPDDSAIDWLRFKGLTAMVESHVGNFAPALPNEPYLRKLHTLLSQLNAS